MKFEVIKNKEYVAKFVLKENGTTTALELSASDTGVFSISKIGKASELVIDSVAMEITDASNGEFTLTLTPEETALLDEEVALKEDGFPSFANYRGVAEFVTETQGKMLAVVDRIYCIDIGA